LTASGSQVQEMTGEILGQGVLEGERDGGRGMNGEGMRDSGKLYTNGMKNSSARSGRGKTSVSRSLRTGRIKATKTSASAIRKSLGVTASEAKVAAKVVLATKSATKAKSRGASKVGKSLGVKSSSGGVSKEALDAAASC
jgi:hypothetical protein